MFYTFLLSKIEVGAHYYIHLNKNLHFHGETIFVSFLVVLLICGALLFSTKKLTQVPNAFQNAAEILYEFVKSIAVAQLGLTHYKQYLPFIATMFFFVLGSNWAGALIPWKIFQIPEGEFAAPTNDINTTACLALLTSFMYFGAGLKAKGLKYFTRYIKPSVFLLPINIIEDFTKPLSLNFRLFGNIVADELTVGVLCSLVPIIVPIPIMVLGLFASSIQALIFATLAAAYIGEAIE
jgi:F-type H+-transporting ATPase subunit a